MTGSQPQGWGSGSLWRTAIRPGQRRAYSLFRVLGIAWLGVVVFVIQPGPPRAVPAQAASYAVTAAGVACWVALENRPDLVARPARWLAVILGVVAVASGFASATGNGATYLVAFSALAALIAAGDLDLGPAVAVTVAGILATVVSGLFYGSPEVYLWLPIFTLSCVVVGRGRAAYRVQAEQSAELLAQRERLAEADRRADVLDERARIAREIHDVLAHSLGALSIQIQAARSVLTDSGDIGHASDLLAAAQKMAGEGLTETRRAVQALRAGQQPLSEELARAAGSYGERFGGTATFTAAGQPRPVPPEATVALLRVAQESLVNAAKHAPGQPVTLNLAYGDTGLALTISNDLRTGSPDGPADGNGNGLHTVDSGYGLTGMAERLALLKGSLEAGRRDGQWVVTALVPLPKADTMAG